jgi:hypothetical protein
MRFDHFFYLMHLDASRNDQALADCLAEAELVEHLGFDAIWISEHHCAGEAVDGDALGFGAAVAVKTQRVLLGLGVVEMALHNPVQMAIQTALPHAAYAPTPDRKANASLVSSPQRVTAQRALLQEYGVSNLMVTNRGLISQEQTRSSLRLRSEQMRPALR